VEKGSITIEMATDLFNRAYDLVLEKAKAENEKLEKKL
jgi:hypothetical protein